VMDIRKALEFYLNLYLNLYHNQNHNLYQYQLSHMEKLQGRAFQGFMCHINRVLGIAYKVENPHFHTVTLQFNCPGSLRWSGERP
jgi:hypothetical protein